eukprot:820757-Amphidinium_carterae.1
MENLKKQFAALKRQLGNKPAQGNAQPPNKGSGKGTRREACLLQVQGGESTKEGDARSAGTQTQTCLLFARRPQEAYRSGQGLAGPATATAEYASCCATAEKRSSPGSGPQSTSLRASTEPCGQDGPASQDCPGGQQQTRTIQGRIGHGVCALGKATLRALASAKDAQNPETLLAMMAFTKSKLRTSARKALGKGAGLRRSAPLELMAHGGPAADPQVSADLSAVRVWNRRILAGKQFAANSSGLLKPVSGMTPSSLEEVEGRYATASSWPRLGWVPAHEATRSHSASQVGLCSSPVCGNGQHQERL